MKIIKRDGREVPFDRNKIWSAIAKADADIREEGGKDVLASVDITAMSLSIEEQCAALNRASRAHAAFQRVPASA